MKPKTFLIIGAGDRGFVYAEYAKHFPERMKVIGIAEPREFQRNKMAKEHKIAPEFVFDCFTKAAELPKFADAVIIATQDSMHTEPAIAFAKLGYHILLEKPMAPTENECKQIVEEVKKQNVMFAVCHVLRYTNYTQKLKELLSAGTIGKIISLQHLEPVGYWHQAHSFVRGNWRNTNESTFMLLAKSCHDLDWIRYIAGNPCKRVSSFGKLSHFKTENQPDGAADRCLECPENIETKCPYSAKKIYFGFLKNGVVGWPLSVLHPKPTKESITKALQNGPYGRCAYKCDNDVVDHQVVNMQFTEGQTATFTMTAFTQAAHRKTRIFGSKGELEGDGRFIKIFDFLTDKTTEIDTEMNDGIMQGHGGGDFGIMQNFVDALISDNPEMILSGADESLESHLMVFRAEESRLEKQMKEI